MAASMRGQFGNILEEIFNLSRSPEDYLKVQKGYEKRLSKTLKQIYDSTKSSEDVAQKSSSVLPELIVEGFDEEQIWQQLELQNDSSVNNLVTGVARLLTDKTTCSFLTKPPTRVKEKKASKPVKQKKHKIPALEDDFDTQDFSDAESDNEINNSDSELTNIKAKVDGEEDDKFFDFTGDSDDDLNFDFGALGQKSDLGEELYKGDDESEDRKGDENKKNKNKNKKSVSFEDELDSDADTVSKKGKGKANKKGAKAKKGSLKKTEPGTSSHDDFFYNMSELESFLDSEDRKEERRRKKSEKGETDGDSDEEDELEEVDLFDDMAGDEDVHYDDFFEHPDGESNMAADDDDSDDDDDDQDQQSFERAQPRGQRKADLLADSDSEGEDVADILGGKKQDKSTYELRQDKLKKKISAMEDEILAEKPWQLTGEIAGGSRPENSLLQESLQFEYTTRLPPEITEETTKTLEDLVRQRIKDKAWDDVERQIKPKENPFEYKKRITLDQEKSKLSLGEIYEQEYLKQQKTEEEEVKDPDHEDIKKMMTSLFLKLDALSNFHYTPKQASTEVQIVSNQPSITMEEVAPVSVTDTKLLAPEEVKDKKKGEMKGSTEKDAADKMRDRKKKKAAKRERQNDKDKRQKLVEKLNPGLGNKYSKEKALRELERGSKSGKGGVSFIKDKKEKSGLTSSKSFFNQLQDEVTTRVNTKRAEKRRKDELVKSGNSKKYKL